VRNFPSSSSSSFLLMTVVLLIFFLFYVCRQDAASKADRKFEKKVQFYSSEC